MNFTLKFTYIILVLEGLIIVEMYNYMYIVNAFCNNIETSIVYKSYITEQ